jgi:hypothetical protein
MTINFFGPIKTETCTWSANKKRDKKYDRTTLRLWSDCELLSAITFTFFRLFFTFLFVVAFFRWVDNSLFYVTHSRGCVIFMLTYLFWSLLFKCFYFFSSLFYYHFHIVQRLTICILTFSRSTTRASNYPKIKSVVEVGTVNALNFSMSGICEFKINVFFPYILI